MDPGNTNTHCRSRERSSWTRRDREDQHATSPREGRRQGGRQPARGRRTDEARSKPPGEPAASADVGTSGWGPVVPDSRWDLEESEPSDPKSGAPEQKRASPMGKKAVTKTEDPKEAARSSFQSDSGSGQPLESGSGQPPAHQTKVFSLNVDSKLQVRSEDKRAARGKSKGRGWREKLGAPKVGAMKNADSPSSSGITVIEPLEKRLTSEQTEDVGQEGYIPSGHRLAGVQGSPSEGKTQAESAEGEQEGQGSLAQASKPKRYSSRRQKMDPTTEEQPQGMILQTLPCVGLKFYF